MVYTRFKSSQSKSPTYNNMASFMAVSSSEMRSGMKMICLVIKGGKCRGVKPERVMEVVHFSSAKAGSEITPSLLLETHLSLQRDFISNRSNMSRATSLPKAKKSLP